jgi:hypothetical protein
MALEIAYVRTHEAYDRCHVVRDDGTEDAYRFHAYGGALPHELVHCMAAIAEIAKLLTIPTPPTAAQVRHARALLHELRDRFAALGPRQALDLEFGVDAAPPPARSSPRRKLW